MAQVSCELLQNDFKNVYFDHFRLLTGFSKGKKNVVIEIMKMADRWLQKGYPYCQMTSPTVFELGNCLRKKMGR